MEHVVNADAIDATMEERNQGLSPQGVRVSFWHSGPRKIPILEGKDTLFFGQNL